MSGDFEADALDEHNRYRALHGSPPLKLNQELCDYAKEWATHLANRNTIGHRPNLKYGENVFMAGGMDVNGRTAVQNWYKEVNNFDFNNGGFSMNSGHFTQIVWKDSKELGIAMAKRGNSTWVVANYSPAGNVAGCFRENVSRLL